MVEVGCVRELRGVKVWCLAMRAVERDDASLEMWHRLLRHEMAYVLRIDTDPINDYLSVSVVDGRQLITGFGKAMQVDAGLLGMGGGPHNRWIGAPYLYPAGVVVLVDIDCPWRLYRPPLLGFESPM